MGQAWKKIEDGIGELVEGKLGERLAEIGGRLDALTGRLLLLEQFSTYLHDLAVGAPGDQLIVGTGDAVQDQTNLETALAALKIAGGTLWLQGEVIFPDKMLEFPDLMLALRGRGGMAKIKSRRRSGVCCGWRPAWGPSIAGSCSTASPLSSFVSLDVSVPGPNYPRPGEWIIIWSDDELAGVPPHHGAGGKQHPMEIHRVESVDMAKRLVKLCDPVIDRISKNGRFCVAAMLKDKLVEDIEFEHAATEQGEYAVSLYVGCCARATLRRVRQARNGAGAIAFQYSADCLMVDCDLAGSRAVDMVYGITTGVTNGIHVTDSGLSGTRHPVTTNAGVGKLKSRWGTSIATTLNDCVVNIPSNDDGGARVGIDTHPEGYLFTVRDCLIRVGGDVSNTAVQTRSRASRIVGNTILGGNSQRSDAAPLAKAIRVYAADAIVADNTIVNFWLGVGLHGQHASGAVVRDNLIIGCQGPGVYAADCGDGNSIEQNTLRDCGRQATGAPPISSSAIVLRSGTGHRIEANSICKAGNQQAIDVGDLQPSDVVIVDNIMLRYGDMGIAGANQGAFQAAYGDKNTTD